MNIKEAIIKYQKELEKVQVILEKLEKAQGLAVLGATPETEVNATGCRKNGEAYKSTDISDVIKAKKVEGVNPELHEAAKLLLKINKGKL